MSRNTGAAEPGGRPGRRLGGAVWAAIWVIGFAIEAAFGGLLVWAAGRHGPALLAVAVNLAICLRFATTLRAGSVPLITRYARFDEAGLPPECEGYTRALTGIWAALTGLFALIHALAILDLLRTGDVAMAQTALFLALFLGEHALRGRRFPQLGAVTPLRTLHAMVASFGARHAS